MSATNPPVISVMLAVPDAVRAAEWYERGLGAKQLWNLGSVIGLDVEGAAFFVGEPANNGWESPAKLGMPSVRIELSVTIPTHSSHARLRPVRRRAVTGLRFMPCHGVLTARAGSWILSGTCGSSATDRRWLGIRASAPPLRALQSTRCNPHLGRTAVFKWLRAPLSSAEIAGYLVYVAGFAILMIRGAFHDPWIETGLVLTVVGLVVAGRGQASRAA